MKNRTSPGFTLIELMVVVAIVAILATIAYPAYREQMRRGYRSEAKTFLLDNAQFLERNFTANNCYHRIDGNCSTATVTITLPKTQAPESGTARYNLSFSAGPTSSTYTLRAVPTGSMAADPCGTFTLTHLGQQGVSGATRTASDCWAR